MNGFESRESVQQRSHELIIKSGIDKSILTQPLFPYSCLVKETKEQWALEISEDYLSLLDGNEKLPNRLIEIPFIPFTEAYIPMVFRYMKEEYVDEFLSSGKIWLSSFKKFHEHKDEQRGDSNEGLNKVIGKGDDVTFTANMISGEDAFILSTSLNLNKNIQDEFKVDSGFIIEYPIYFLKAIAKEIPNYKGVTFGPCLYQPSHNIERTIRKLNSDQLRSNILPPLIQAAGDDVLFSKTSYYSHQHEYRFLWFSYSDKIPIHLEIVSKEAASYCRKIKKIKQKSKI